MHASHLYPDAKAHQTTLRQRNIAWDHGANAQPLALYVHIPFGNAVWYYSSCNEDKAVARAHGRNARYLRYRERQSSLAAGMLEGSRPASPSSSETGGR